MGTVHLWVWGSAACAKRGGQLTQHHPVVCVCSLDSVFIPSDRIQPQGLNTPHNYPKILLPARALEFLLTPLILILILIRPLFSLPTTTTTRIMGEEDRVIQYHIIISCSCFIGSRTQNRGVMKVSAGQVMLAHVQLAIINIIQSIYTCDCCVLFTPHTSSFIWVVH